MCGRITIFHIQVANKRLILEQYLALKELEVFVAVDQHKAQDIMNWLEGILFGS